MESAKTSKKFLYQKKRRRRYISKENDYRIDMWQEVKRRWLVLGVLTAVALAVLAPKAGAPGGCLHTEYLQYLPLWYIYFEAGKRTRVCWRRCRSSHTNSLHQNSFHSNTLIPNTHHTNTLTPNTSRSNTLPTNQTHSDLLHPHHLNRPYSDLKSFHSKLLPLQLRNLHSKDSHSNTQAYHSNTPRYLHKSLHSCSKLTKPLILQHSNSQPHSLHSNQIQPEHSMKPHYHSRNLRSMDSHSDAQTNHSNKLRHAHNSLHSYSKLTNSLNLQHSNSRTHSLHSITPHYNSTPLKSRWRLAALCAFHAHIVAPALCVVVVTAFRDSGVDHRVVKGMMLASAGGPCGWLSLAFSRNTTTAHHKNCSFCDTSDETKGINTKTYCDTSDEKYRSDVQNVNEEFSVNNGCNKEAIDARNCFDNNRGSDEDFENNDNFGKNSKQRKDNNSTNDNRRSRHDERGNMNREVNSVEDNEYEMMTPLLLLANYVTGLVAIPALMVVICGRGTIPHLGGILSDALTTFPPFILGALLAGPIQCHCSETSVRSVKIGSVNECNGYTSLNIDDSETGATIFKENINYGALNDLFDDKDEMLNGKDYFGKKNKFVPIIKENNGNNDSKDKDFNFLNGSDNEIFTTDDYKQRNRFEIKNEQKNCDINNIAMIDGDSEKNYSKNHSLVNNRTSKTKMNEILDNESNLRNTKVNKDAKTARSETINDIERITTYEDFIDKTHAQKHESTTKIDRNGDNTHFNVEIEDAVEKIDNTGKNDRQPDSSGGITDYSSIITSEIVLRICGLVLVYCECCERLREAEGSLFVGDLLLTLVLALSWVVSSACFCLVYSRTAAGGVSASRAVLLCAMPKCFHAGWSTSSSCSPSGLSLLPGALLAPAQALLLAALVTHT